MHVIRLAIPALVAMSLAAGAQSTHDATVFERIFGISRNLSSERVDEVKALDPGQRLTRDTDGDGRIDEMWYLDTAKRHTANPLLVRVRDEDGDMHHMGRGDLDSDVYFWDHKADGLIDCVTDYQDDDGDGDVDQMGIFFGGDPSGDGIRVWWGVDIGDDNLLWYDVNGNYYQRLCQWRTHFSGDEVFYQFQLKKGDEQWLNVFEDPFAFYDLDGDQCSEVVVRISAKGKQVENLRYSADADDDAFGRRAYDYDFSVTAYPPEQGISPPKSGEATLTIRGIETHPVLIWEHTRAFADAGPWGTTLLTWDEINTNTEVNVAGDPHERWEGIIAHPSKHGDFRQVGGPPCSPLNKRVELAKQAIVPLRLYLDPVDRRLHLLGAAYGYMDVDYDFDGTLDAAYTWSDDDGDGQLDHRHADLDGDGAVDLQCPMAGSAREFPLGTGAITAFYPAYLQQVLAESQEFMDAGLAAFEIVPGAVAEVIDYYAGPLALHHPEAGIGARIQSTPAGTRFYMDLARDRLFAALRAEHGGKDGWKGVEQSYHAGRFAEAARRLVSLTGPQIKPEPRPVSFSGQEYTQYVSVTIDNAAQPPREGWPVTLAVESLKQRAADFNPANCAVAPADCLLAWRETPHQVDAFEGAPALSFLADLPGNAARNYRIYYAPAGAREVSFPLRTAAVLDNPAYVAWESDAAAFRFYTGQFDFFGKHESRVLAPQDRLIYPLINVNYHAEQDWGMDALHVNKTSGLGGVTVTLGGKDCLVQSPGGEGHVEFKHRVLGAGPVRSTVEITARNVFPGRPDAVVRLRCLIYAGRRESEVRVQLPDGLGETLVAPGLLRLEEGHPFALQQVGAIGTWGRQGPDIGEIGLGVICEASSVARVVDLETERRIQCRADGDTFRYWIVGTWRRGMQFPIAPTVDNWRRTLAELATELNHLPEIRVEQARRVGEE